MKILILYMSTHGCSQKVANMIVEKMDEYDVTVHNLKEKMLPHLGSYEVVIIGGSIHVGKVQAKIKSFCEKNEDTLLQKKLGLYLCCMEKGDLAAKQFREAYPEKLRNVAKAKALVGGEFDFNKMNFFEKAVVKKIANIEDSVSEIKIDIIDEFVNKIKETIKP